MAQLMLGKDVNESLADRIREKIAEAEKTGVVPGLLIIRVGEKESDLSYEKGAVKRCRSFGINVRSFWLRFMGPMKTRLSTASSFSVRFQVI